MEFEQFINRFRNSGQEEVARKLNEVLETYRDSLPSQLPQKELVLEDGESRVVVTRQMVEDPDSLSSVLGKLLRITPRPAEFTTSRYLALLSRTENKLLSYAHPFDMRRALSLSELIIMPDDELLRIRQFGVNGLWLFRRATLPVKEKFFEQTT